jgi:antirestriction protein ArdC
MYVPAAADSKAEASATAQQEETPMNTQATTTTVNPSTQNPKQPQQKQTAKEAIAANVKALIEQLEQGHSEALTAYLTTMGRFHNYSFGNILEIARQKPDATRVAGLYAWNQLGRKVRKGEHGIRILAPVIGIQRKKNTEAEKDIRTQNEPVLVGFRNAYVFDVSQTEGTELPELSERVTGSVGEYRERLTDFVIAQGILLEWKEGIAPAMGVSYGGKIVLLPGQSTAEEFSTLVHELAHEMLHKAERRTATTKVVRETEAEAIAFVVGQTIGLNTGRASADYIHLYHGNAALLAESLEVIQKTSAVILSALENHAVEATTEAEPELAQAS